ncbi:MAG: phosphate ABC transporter permease PstA [Planctomycetota bacterium]
MTTAPSNPLANDRPDPRRPNPAAELARLGRRRLRDQAFYGATLGAIGLAAMFIVVFLGNLIAQGVPALRQAQLQTTVTYSPQTVNDAQLAFPEDVRDLVSRERVREIARQASRVRIQLPVDLDAAAQRRPRAGLTDTTLALDDFPAAFVRLGRITEPVAIPRDAVLRFVGRPGLDDIQRAIDNGQTGTAPLWLWATDALSAYVQFGEGLSETDRALVASLEQARKVEQAFNTLDYGTGVTATEWVLLDDDADQYLKGYDRADPRTYPDPANAPLSLAQADRIDDLLAEGRIRLALNTGFFINGDSNQPEAAGVWPAVWGSVMVLTIVFCLAVPIGVLTSIYLEEFAPDNWLTRTIEVNINNLAAVPSILFGVLGLAALINFIGMPRSSALVGGATLSLMTLPVVIISSRAALRAVPDSIRRAAYAMGATRWQVVTHHVLPLAIPGIMTGSIIGIAQAMGETAPLIIIGLIAFVPDAASSALDPTTVMPAQVFNWWGNSQPAFTERAALMILLLLAVLFVLNGVAVFIRAKFEKQW